MKRRLLVDQRESDAGQFWWVVRGGNRQVLATSEMYTSRSNAIRAARRFISAISPVSALLSYWVGDRPTRHREIIRSFGREPASLDRRRVSESIR